METRGVICFRLLQIRERIKEKHMKLVWFVLAVVISSQAAAEHKHVWYCRNYSKDLNFCRYMEDNDKFIATVSDKDGVVVVKAQDNSFQANFTGEGRLENAKKWAEKTVKEKER